MPTIIASCSCQSAYQDQKYGKGMRVKNTRGGKNKDKGPTCTVCGRD